MPNAKVTYSSRVLIQGMQPKDKETRDTEMVSCSIVIQKKEQKMRRKNWCMQRVDEEVVQVLRGLT